MTSTTSPAPLLLPPPARAQAAGPPRSADPPDRRGPLRVPGALGAYTDSKGRRRELVAQRGSAGSVLVLDRHVTRADVRLVAHLGSDEPRENAALVCRSYLQDARGAGPCCRRVTPADFETPPFGDDQQIEPEASAVPADARAVDRLDCCYRLEQLFTGMSIPELRWRRHPPERAGVRPHTVSVRDAIARLESYEPVRTLTRRALARHRADTEVSSTVLRVELRRIQQSPIVLNRRLREVVLATVEREGLSMSEIAIRCGRIKRDRCGNESGETSWLARRLGMLPEGGRSTPTPWIHSDVLALVARRGLGISPREVELD